MTAPIEDVGQFDAVPLRTYALIRNERIASITRANGTAILHAMPGVEDVLDVTNEVRAIGPGWWWVRGQFFQPSAERP